MSSTARSASAPGKLFLTGEYAVLEGAPAVLTPVPVRAVADVAELNRQGEVITITTQEHRQPLATAVISEPLLAAVVTELQCADELNSLQLTLDSAQFFRGDQKLGFGSSAAMTVALVKLLLPGANDEELLERAVACHRRFQGGAGSGADIALSVMDQPIVFTMGSHPLPVKLPENLSMLAIWTGSSASTTDYLTRLGEWKSENASLYVEHLTRLTDIARQFAEIPSAEVLVGLARDYGQALDDLSRVSGTGFYTNTHVALRNKVESAHLSYKPSGAGGGDFGIAFGVDAHAMRTLAESLNREGFYTLRLTEQ